MTTYAVGDLQGCFYSLQNLLDKIDFDSTKDELWLVGDVINRGQGSLQTLEWCYENQDNLKVVLGNHDLHFLSIAFKQKKLSKSDTVGPILASGNCDKYVDWMLTWPLIYSNKNFLMVHAGLMPQWSTVDAVKLSKEISISLKKDPRSFLMEMYGNKPDQWSSKHTKRDLFRLAINATTRLRCLKADASIDFSYKSDLDSLPVNLIPWFKFQPHHLREEFIISGHWSAVGIQRHDYGITLDTGCVWGGKLSAYAIDSGLILSVDADRRDLA
jgi:bis(5'-nucleosyl)-tetraphosphatase (symmetrical)